MKRMKTDRARNEFGAVVNEVAYGKEWIILERRGKPMAAMVPVEDLRLLERLIAEEEDRIDLEAMRAAEGEPGEAFPYDEVRKELALDELSPDDDTGRKAGARRNAKTRAVAH